MKFTHYRILLLTVVILLTALNLFAQSVREKGIELYKYGDYAEAILYLERAAAQKDYQKDGEIWNYIGLAYINRNMEKDGRKAFEKAVKYAPTNSNYRANLAYAHLLNRKSKKAQSVINKAIQLDPKNANAYFIRGTANLWDSENTRAVADAEKSIALDPKLTAAYILHTDSLLTIFGEKWGDDEKPLENLNLLERAGESLKRCLSDCPKDDSLKTITQRADTINAFLDYFKKTKSPIATPGAANANIIPLNITHKPTPKYTNQARQANETGNVRIAMMFGADGKTKYLMILKGLRYGLNEQALIAASGIRFEPQKIDGNPVSVVRIVVFSYTIY